MFTVKFAVAVFPARSVAVPVTTWFAPAAVTSTGVGHMATLLSESEHVKFTVTLLLFQPLASGGGLTVPEIIGGVLSRFTMIDVVARFPALSMAIPCSTLFPPSVVLLSRVDETATHLSL